MPYFVDLAVASTISVRIRLPGFSSRFRELKIPKTLLYPRNSFIGSRNPPHHRLLNAPSHGATITCLSCTSTPDFSRCQSVQISPRDPVAFPQPQKPACQARVTLFRYVPRVGLFQFTHFQAYQVTPAFPPACRFPVAQSFDLAIESKDGVSPSSARRSRTSPTTGMRLRRSAVGWQPTACRQWGWRAPSLWRGWQPHQAWRG